MQLEYRKHSIYYLFYSIASCLISHTTMAKVLFIEIAIFYAFSSKAHCQCLQRYFIYIYIVNEEEEEEEL